LHSPLVKDVPSKEAQVTKGKSHELKGQSSRFMSYHVSVSAGFFPGRYKLFGFVEYGSVYLCSFLKVVFLDYFLLN
jgi:hypothetical protein